MAEDAGGADDFAHMALGAFDTAVGTGARPDHMEVATHLLVRIGRLPAPKLGSRRGCRPMRLFPTMWGTAWYTYSWHRRKSMENKPVIVQVVLTLP